MYLSWTKSYKQEVKELKYMISCKPSDVRLLKEELENLMIRGAEYTEEVE
jgi:hypothetical protein